MKTSIIFGLVLILGFSVCVATAQTSTNSPVRLKPAMFTDYEFTLISDKDYLHYSFRENGRIAESFGQKAIIGLDEGWRIEHGKTLVFPGAPGVGPANRPRPGPNPRRQTL